MSGRQHTMGYERMPRSSDDGFKPLAVVGGAIGAGAIELAGARAPPPNFWQRGHGGHNRIYGAPVKRLMKMPNIQQRKCSACHPLATDTLPLINSFVDHTVFYVGADSSQTPLHLNQPLYLVVDWIQVWYTRVDGRKYLNTFHNC